jgi:hypothetical protein
VLAFEPNYLPAWSQFLGQQSQYPDVTAAHVEDPPPRTNANRVRIARRALSRLWPADQARDTSRR